MLFILTSKSYLNQTSPVLVFQLCAGEISVFISKGETVKTTAPNQECWTKRGLRSRKLSEHNLVSSSLWVKWHISLFYAKQKWQWWDPVITFLFTCGALRGGTSSLLQHLELSKTSKGQVGAREKDFRVPAVAREDRQCQDTGLIPSSAQWVKGSGFATGAAEVEAAAQIWFLAWELHMLQSGQKWRRRKKREREHARERKISRLLPHNCPLWLITQIIA